MTSIEKINNLLLEHGLSGADLSREINVSNSVYSQWNTKTTKPSKKSLKKIADFFGVNVSDLLDDDDPPMTSHAISPLPPLKNSNKKTATKSDGEVEESIIKERVSYLNSMFLRLNSKNQLEAIIELQERLQNQLTQDVPQESD